MVNVDDIQQKVDIAKGLAVISNVHKIIPPNNNKQDEIEDIRIIESLKVSPRLEALYLELRGLIKTESGEIIQYSEPIMNEKGSFKMITELKHIAEETEWANYKEDKIAGRILFHYNNILPAFYNWMEEYELHPRNLDYVQTTLFVYIDASFHKAINGTYARLISKVYNEDFLGKVMNPDKEKKGGFLSNAREAIFGKK